MKSPCTNLESSLFSSCRSAWVGLCTSCMVFIWISLRLTLSILSRRPWYSKSTPQLWPINFNKCVVSDSKHNWIVSRVCGAHVYKVRAGLDLFTSWSARAFSRSWIVTSLECVFRVTSQVLRGRNKCLKFFNFWLWIITIYIADSKSIEYRYLVGIWSQRYFHMCRYSCVKATQRRLCTCSHGSL